MDRRFPFSVGTHPQAPLYPSGQGGSGGVGGGGTIGKIPIWSGPSTLADSSVSEDAGVVTVAARLSVEGEADANDFVLVGGTPGGGGPAAALIAVLDEGDTVASSVSSINFVGAGVTASAVDGAVTVEITFDQAAADSRYAQIVHTHSASDITDLASAVAGVGDARYLKLTGGELTGPLLGTTADFSGEVDADDFVLVGGTGGGGASAALFSVLDEGVLKANNVTTLNFTGAGVVASAVGSNVTVEIVFDQVAADARYSLLGHTHTFASLTSRPTTIGGYGITDFTSLGDARWLLLDGTAAMTGTLLGMRAAFGYASAAPASGHHIELYADSGVQGVILSYDRTAGAYKPLVIGASSTSFSQGGISVSGNVSAQGGTFSGDVAVGANVNIASQFESSLVGMYDPTKYRGIYAMGDLYKLGAGGTTLGGLYGLFFAYDNTDTSSGYKNITGWSCGHGFGLAEAGVAKFYCGALGMWHSGDATAHDFILS